MFHELAAHKEAEIIGGHLRLDHVHMCLRIPPKCAVSNVIGYLKGKSAIMIARFFVGKERNFIGENFWARGYFVSTVKLDEATVVEYIRNQEARREAPRAVETAGAALSGPICLSPLCGIRPISHRFRRGLFN